MNNPTDKSNSLDPNLLEWGAVNNLDKNRRLYYEGEPSSIIKMSNGAITTDPFPSEIPLLGYSWSVGKVTEYDNQGAIRYGEIGLQQQGEFDSSFSVPEIVHNESSSAGSRFVLSSTSVLGQEGPAPSKWESIKSPPKAKGGARTDSSRRGFLIGSLTVGVLVIGGAVTGVTILNGNNKAEAESTAPSNQTIASGKNSPLGTLKSGKVETVALGWAADKPVWTFQLKNTATAISSFDHETVLASGSNLTILSNKDGSTIESIDIGGLPTLIADSTFGDKDRGIVWRISDTMYLWSANSKKVIQFDIDSGAVVSTSGTGTLIKTDTLSAVPTMSGLIPVPNSDGTEISTDGDNVVASSWNGPVKLRNLTTGKTSQQLITPPEPGLVINNWFGAGSGVFVLSWKDPKLATDDKTPVTVSVHSIEDGKSRSSFSTTIGNTKSQSLMFGQGNKEFALGPLLFDTESGKLLVDASEDIKSFQVITDHFSYGTNKKGGVSSFINGKPQTKVTATTPLAVTEQQEAIVRVSSDTIARLRKE